MINEVAPGKVLYTDALDTGPVAVAKGAVGVVAASFIVRNGLRPFLVFVGDAWDGTLDTYLTKRIKVDGAVLWRFRDSKVQFADPARPSSEEISPWIELPQGATVSYEYDVAAAGPATANIQAIRFVIKYLQQENG